MILRLLIPLFCLIIPIVNAQKYDAEVIKFDKWCQVEKSEVTTYNNITLKVNNKNGEKYSLISIPYSKDIKVSEIKAWVEDSKGIKVKELKKSDIIDRSEFSHDLYTDRMLKIFQLVHNNYPYFVSCSFTYTDKNYMTVGSWSPVLFQDIPTQASTFVVSAPTDLPLVKSVKNLTNTSEEVKDNRRILAYSASYTTPFKDEIYSDPSKLLPYVEVLPLNFERDLPGSWDSWKSYGDWVYGLGEGLDELTETEKQTVKQLIAGISDKKEIVRKLYHYMQDHTRYINVSIGIGALKPFPAEYVCKNKYGDCKALTNYMKAMLKEAGISSFPADVYSDDESDEFDTEFPSHQFNHVVLMVPLENDTIWLENTSNSKPFNYMGTSTQGHYALVVDKGNSRLVRIPELTPSEVLQEKHIWYELKKEGHAVVSINNIYRGDDFELFNAVTAQLNETEKDQLMREYMPFDNYEVIKWNLDKKHRDDPSISLTAELTLNKVLNSLGQEYYVSLPASGIPGFSNPTARTLPVELLYPIAIRDTITYSLPEGMELKSQFQPVSVEGKFGSFSLKIYPEAGKVKAVKSFLLNRGYISLMDYPEFYKFIDTAKKADRSRIVIQPIKTTI